MGETDRKRTQEDPLHWCNRYQKRFFFPNPSWCARSTKESWVGVGRSLG